MKTPALTVGEAMADYASGADVVLMCRCGEPMRPTDMRRIPTGPGNNAITRIGCPTCYCNAALAISGVTS